MYGYDLKGHTHVCNSIKYVQTRFIEKYTTFAINRCLIF